MKLSENSVDTDVWERVGGLSNKRTRSGGSETVEKISERHLNHKIEWKSRTTGSRRVETDKLPVYTTN